MKLRALVVDDDRTMRNVLIQLLPVTRLAEFQFAEAEDGVEALAKLGSSRFDIAFVDINMPKMSGMGFVRKARAAEKNRHLPIVMVTGEASMGKIEEALDEAGADLYITKPFTVDTLRQQLAKLVDRITADENEKRGKKALGLWARLVGKG